MADELVATRILLAANSEQKLRLHALEQLCADKMAELAQPIALRLRGDLASALAVVRTDRGMELMASIRGVAAQMMDEEHRALAVSQPRSLTAARTAALVIAGKVRRIVEESRGKPIPAVTTRAAPGRLCGDIAPMASIDAAVVRRMLGDDSVLFRTLLDRTPREFTDLSLPISLSAGDPATRKAVKDRTHKLSGSAGVIGATTIARLAGEAEEALEEARPDDCVEAILRRLAAVLTCLREEAELLAATERASGSVTNSPEPQRRDLGAKEIEALYEMLESQNLAALDRFAQCASSLSELLGAVRFERVRNAIDNLEFQTGAALLREALLPVNPPTRARS